MDAISAIKENPLFVELRRALDLEAPDDVKRQAVKNEAERLMRELTNGNGGETKGLHEAALNASSMKVEGWYATEALTQIISTIGTHPWDEHSRLLLIKIAGMAIADSRNDRRYAKAYNGLVEPLRRLASDENADVDTRAEAIMAIASFRGSEGQRLVLPGGHPGQRLQRRDGAAPSGCPAHPAPGQHMIAARVRAPARGQSRSMHQSMRQHACIKQFFH